MRSSVPSSSKGRNNQTACSSAAGLWNITPLASRAQHIHEAVHDFPRLNGALASAAFGRRIKGSTCDHSSFVRSLDNRGGSVCLNRFSGLISGVPAVVTKMMDPRSGPLELFFLFRSLTAVSLFKFSCLPRRLLLLPLACGQRDCVVQALRHAKRHVHSRCDLLPRVPAPPWSHLSITPLRQAVAG